MRTPTPKSALQLLRWPLAATVLGIITATLFVVGSYFYLEYQKKSDAQSKRALQEAQARVTNANKEAEDLRGSIDLYQQLVAYGVFQKESRLGWIETLNQLKAKHKLSALEYDLSPQRTIAQTGGRSFPSIDIAGSRVTLKAQSYHDGDLMNFLSDITHLGKGFYPMDHCAIRLLEPQVGNPLAPRIEANCAFDWVTLKDKRASVLASGNEATSNSISTSK